jgi:hypothetical protein
MTTVRDLRPGEVIELHGDCATVVAVHHPHPKYPTLSMVIWRVFEGPLFKARWSVDALDPRQEVGELSTAFPQDLDARWTRIKELFPTEDSP